jgi:CheY-like chemotaxis protein
MLRILIADDNQDGGEALARLLGLIGHEVSTVQRADEVLDAARRWEPQLILLDLCMPHTDGFEVLRLLRGDCDTCHATIMALTGLASEEYKLQTAAAGFDGHLVKPVALATLQNVLAEVGSKLEPARGRAG